MKHNKFVLGLSCALAALSLSGCGASEEALILKALNCEDYIGEDSFEFTYENAEGKEVTITYDDVISGFEAYESEKLGKPVKVIYDTYDTNETMLSSLKTGKSTYDLICASDYTIQKMMMMGMLQKIDRDAVPNYADYASRYHLEMMESITANVPQGDGSEKEEIMADYSIGYMWGTLGILYNPAKIAADKGLDENEIKFDMQSWESLWNPKYKSEMSVKDSMRDTYSVGIMRQYNDEIVANMEKSGCFDMESPSYDLKEGAYEKAAAEYAPTLNEIFNRCDEKTTNAVKADLLALKENVFGFEVDSGKDDMVKGLVGMNLAWSGDAVYSMDKGDNESGQTIYYSIPKTGGNIWFDSWAIPKTSDAEHKAAAEDFLNFLSDPQVAAANMQTIGYTSFIAGETVHGLIREWFDPRSYAMWVYHEASWWEDNTFVYADYAEEEKLDEKVFTVVEDGDPANKEDRVYELDFHYDEETGYRYQDGKTYYRELKDGSYEAVADDYGYFDMTGSTFEEACVDGVKMSWEAYQDLYNETIRAELLEEYEDGSEEYLAAYEENSIGWLVSDITYMFEGTIEAPEELGDTPETNPYLFYTDEFEEIENEDGETILAGRQFYAQYPTQNLIPKLAVMKDYGANNKYVLAMWTDVKSNNLPLAGVIVFAIILGAAAAAIISSVVVKHRFHKYKIERRKEAAKH